MDGGRWKWVLYKLKKYMLIQLCAFFPQTEFVRALGEPDVTEEDEEEELEEQFDQ